MLLRGIQWLDPTGSWQRGDLRLRDGRIAEIGAKLGGDDEVLDAGGLRALPGAIDPHVHLRAQGQDYKEGLLHGARAALAGGVTCLLDMPNNQPPCSTLARLAAKQALFRKRCACNWGLQGHATPGSTLPVAGMAALKIYMAKSSKLPAIVDTAVLVELMGRYPRVAFHAEDETAFVDADLPHHERRPREAITRALTSIETALLALPRAQRPRVVICHASTTDELAWLRRMKDAGHDVWGETCPHYLAFTQDDLLREGARFQVNPPIRSAADREALQQGLADGTIDFLATDHAPHALTEKAGAQPPSGIASVEWLLPFATGLVTRGLVSWRRLQELCTLNAAACYGIAQRDGIRVGQVADLVLLAPRSEVAPRTAPITRAGWTPFAQDDFDLAVHTTLGAGRLAYQDGRWPDASPGEELFA